MEFWFKLGLFLMCVGTMALIINVYLLIKENSDKLIKDLKEGEKDENRN